MGYGFDPMGIVGGMSPLAIKNMQAKEINNGRLAMVAVVAYVVQEAMTGEPVTSVSEQFFTPSSTTRGSSTSSRTRSALRRSAPRKSPSLARCKCPLSLRKKKKKKKKKKYSVLIPL